MVAFIVSASALIGGALERSIQAHYAVVEKIPRIEAIAIRIADAEAVFYDMANAEVDVETLLELSPDNASFLRRVAVITRDDLELQGLLPLVGKVGAILPHSSSADEIAMVAQIMRQGLEILPAEILPLVQAGISKRSASKIPAAYSLTEREKAVVDMLAEGASNKTIARALDINDTTVRVHVRSILQKLDVTNRTQAALLVAKGDSDRQPPALAARASNNRRR